MVCIIISPYWIFVYVPGFRNAYLYASAMDLSPLASFMIPFSIEKSEDAMKISGKYGHWKANMYQDIRRCFQEFASSRRWECGWGMLIAIEFDFRIHMSWVKNRVEIIRSLGLSLQSLPFKRYIYISSDNMFLFRL